MKYYGKKKSWKNLYRVKYYKYLINRYLKNCDTILDIGAGTGLFYDIAKETHKVEGIDFDKRNVRDNIVLKDFKDIDKCYDCFWASHFIEHLTIQELELFMQIAEKYCNSILVIITPKDNKNFWDTPDHIRPYNKKALKRLINEHSFVEIKYKNLFPASCHMIIARKVTMPNV